MTNNYFKENKSKIKLGMKRFNHKRYSETGCPFSENFINATLNKIFVTLQVNPQEQQIYLVCDNKFINVDMGKYVITPDMATPIDIYVKSNTNNYIINALEKLANSPLLLHLDEMTFIGVTDTNALCHTMLLTAIRNDKPLEKILDANTGCEHNGILVNYIIGARGAGKQAIQAECARNFINYHCGLGLSDISIEPPLYISLEDMNWGKVHSSDPKECFFSMVEKNIKKQNKMESKWLSDAVYHNLNSKGNFYIFIKPVDYGPKYYLTNELGTTPPNRLSATPYKNEATIFTNKALKTFLSILTIEQKVSLLTQCHSEPKTKLYKVKYKQRQDSFWCGKKWVEYEVFINGTDKEDIRAKVISYNGAQIVTLSIEPVNGEA